MKVSELSDNETFNRHGVDGNLIPLSFYNNRPVCFMKNVCDTIQWETKQHNVWCKYINKIVYLKFYLLNIVDEYNTNMNNVELLDHLLDQYTIENRKKKRKWCIDFFLWVFGVLLYN